MENISLKEKRFQFHGDGASLFKIFIINYLLTIVTLGIYYPWAKAALLQYFYQETEFEDSRFQFHGTGKEMFIGTIKALVIIAALAGVYFVLDRVGYAVIGFIINYICVVILIPVAIVAGLKYRLSRSSWRGIHFGYRGRVIDMAVTYYLGFFLTLLSLGIYSSWYIVNLQKHVKSNARFGNIEFEFTGEGKDLFITILIGQILTAVTLGIYSFWLKANLFNYFNCHTYIIQDGARARLNSTVTGGKLLGLFLGNFLLITLTLGAGIPWAILRNQKYYQANLSVIGSLNLQEIRQTEQSYTDASGDGFIDNLELSLGY